MDSKELIDRAVLDLFLWRKGGSDHFTVKLYELMAKADASNLYRLGMSFPTEHAAFKAWQKSPTEEQYFKDMGLNYETIR